MEVQVRKMMYYFLSLLLDIPQEEFLRLICSMNLNSQCLQEVKQALPPELLNKFLYFLETIAEEQSNFQSFEDYFTSLSGEYARLFHYSRPRLVPPYESVYTEKRLFGERTMEIKRLYVAAGLEFRDPYNLPPDHIAYELEFMSYLCEQEEAYRGTILAEKAREMQREVVCRHLSDFAPEVARRLKMYSKMRFYRLVGELLESFMESEIALFKCSDEKSAK